VRAKPQQLWKLEARERRVARDLAESLGPDHPLDLGALRRGALVVPEQSGANNAIAIVKEYGTVHLTGEADGSAWWRVDPFEALGDDAMPVLWILFCPTRTRRRKRIFAGPGTEHGAAVIDEDNPGARCAYVDAE
jgi:hypothetical protein